MGTQILVQSPTCHAELGLDLDTVGVTAGYESRLESGLLLQLRVQSELNFFYGNLLPDEITVGKVFYGLCMLLLA